MLTVSMKEQSVINAKELLEWNTGSKFLSRKVKDEISVHYEKPEN